jgi:transposase
MGDKWTCIGHETSEQLAVQQREYYVKVIKRKKYVRNSAHSAQGAERGIRVAPPAKVILPRSLADASLLADVLCSKFIDAMSFYRTEKRLRREGIEIGYSTLCDWPIQLYERLKPLERLFYRAIGKSPLWHLDETTLQVLDEPGRANQTNSYLWGIRAGPPDKPVVLFHYHSRRNFEALEEWLRPCLEDFQGVIISDEHPPYNKLAKQYPQIQAHGGCLAHCRRKFADAAKGRRHDSDAHKILKTIALIYKQEAKSDHLSGQARLEARQRDVAPQMAKLKSQLEAMADHYLSKGAMNTAIGYALNQWHKFSAFLSHADLPIDNNPMEQAIRPFTLGRKNWLFAGSPRGASASAFIYSLIESAKANDLEPKRYLNELFERYPLAVTDEQRAALLPWNFEFSK